MSIGKLVNVINGLRDKLVSQCDETPEGADIRAKSISASAGYGPYIVELSIERVEDIEGEGGG